MKHLSISLFAFCILISSCSHQAKQSAESFSGLENPQSRLEYDQMRLADPETGLIPSDMRQHELAFAEKLKAASKKSSSSTTWIPRGPYNIGGRTRAFTFDITDENILLAGGVTGGMWRSVDGGASWNKTTSPGEMQSVTCVAQDKRAGHENVWYSGTGEYYGVVSGVGYATQYSGNGIFKSTDSGQSWTPLASTQSNSPTTMYTTGDFDFVWNIVTDPTVANEDHVYAAVISGISKSTDGGNSWTSVLGIDTSMGNAAYSNIIITPGGVKYAAVNGNAVKGLWRSVDGENWVEITPGSWPNTFSRTVMAYAPTDENVIYFLAEVPNGGTHDHIFWKYTYLSGDGSGAGGQWTNRTANIPSFECHYNNRDFGYFNSQGSYDLCIAVKPNDADAVFLGGTNIYRSMDGFATDDSSAWIGGYQCDTTGMFTLVWPEHHPDQHGLFFHPSNPNILYNGNDGGVYRTDDCMASPPIWLSMNNGYVTTQFYTCAIEPGETSSDLILGGLQDNGTLFTNNSDDTDPWTWVLFGDGSYCSFTHSGDYVYMSKQSGRVFKCTLDANGNLESYSRIDPLGGGGYIFISPFILDPVDDDIMYFASGKYIWKNDGLNELPITGLMNDPIDSNWTKFSNTNSGLNSSITCLNMSPEDRNVLYYGSSLGDLFRLDSLTFGLNVKTEIGAGQLSTGYISSIAVNEFDADDLLVSYSNYKKKSIFHSTDGGQTFTHVSGNLEENEDGTGDGPAVFWVEMLNMSDSIIYYAGTSIGLFSTTELDDSNTVWQMEGEDVIGNSIINMVKSRSHDGYVVVATHGTGVYSTRLKTMTGINNVAQNDFEISVYPNPASTICDVRCETCDGKKIFLEVFNVSGEKIYSTSFSTANCSLPTANWNAGIYFIKLSDGTNSHSQKLVIQ